MPGPSASQLWSSLVAAAVLLVAEYAQEVSARRRFSSGSSGSSESNNSTCDASCYVPIIIGVIAIFLISFTIRCFLIRRRWARAQAAANAAAIAQQNANAAHMGTAQGGNVNYASNTAPTGMAMSPNPHAHVAYPNAAPPMMAGQYYATPGAHAAPSAYVYGSAPMAGGQPGYPVSPYSAKEVVGSNEMSSPFSAHAMPFAANYPPATSASRPAAPAPYPTASAGQPVSVSAPIPPPTSSA